MVDRGAVRLPGHRQPLNEDLGTKSPPTPVDPHHAVGVCTCSNVRDLLTKPEHTGHMIWTRRARKGWRAGCGACRDHRIHRLPTERRARGSGPSFFSSIRAQLQLRSAPSPATPWPTAVLANRKVFGVTCVIRRQRHNHASGFTPVDDRGSPTANHMDDVHVSLHPTATVDVTCCFV